MRQILIPVDGSEESIKALEYVQDRRKRGEKIKPIILYVQPVPLVRNKEIEQILQEDREKVFSDTRILSLMKSLRVTPGFGSGEAAATIVKFAASAGCDEIVMGTRGRGKMKQLVMGSVASKVVHLTKVPVVLVK